MTSFRMDGMKNPFRSDGFGGGGGSLGRHAEERGEPGRAYRRRPERRRSRWASFPRPPGTVPLLAAATAVLLLAGCGGGEGDDREADAPAARERAEEPAAGEPGTGATDGAANPLLDPSSEAMNRTAPDTVRAEFRTSEGTFVVEAYRAWSPHGVDRFYNLVRNGFYDGTCFFRVLDGFVAQFGISGDPEISAAWRNATIPDDPVAASNERGSVTFATGGPDTRTTQLFINLADNARLDDMGFSPVGRVVQGMSVVDALYTGYGEGAPQGSGPSQARIQQEGNAYLNAEFPELDHVERARIVEP